MTGRIISFIGLLFVTILTGSEAVQMVYTPDEAMGVRPPFRRLFLDAMVVEESSGLVRLFHSAEKYQGNPVIKNDKPWEGWGPYLYGTVMWDEGKLKMWYQCLGNSTGPIRGFVCYAESLDGIHWEKPELGIWDYNGSKANNIVETNDNFHIPSVIKRSDGDWVMYGVGGGVGPHVAFSNDGLRWKVRTPDQTLFKSSDVTNYFYDPYRERYVSTYKTANRRHRAVGIAVSNDGLNWTKPIEGPVFGADDLDPDATQIYGMPVFPYQGVYIGLPWMYHARWIKYGQYSKPEVMYEAQKGSPCTVDVQMAWSWNLIQWTRTPDRKPFIGLGPADSFDSKMIYTARAPVVVGDKLYFYYGGWNREHDDFKGVQSAIGLATLRLDGFCSMHAGDNEGWLISRREVFRTPKVTINAKVNPGGYVVAELLDRDNNVIPGFTRNDCIPFTGDSVRHILEWKTKSFPADRVNSDKKVRFYLKNADLYSYLPSDIDQTRDDGKIWEEK